MIEAFTAEHNVSIQEVVFDWPASKFEALYSAYAKRKLADSLSERRALDMAAMWANTNLDSEKNKELRKSWQEMVDENYSDAIMKLYGQATEDAEIDWDDPFLAPSKKAVEKHG